MPHAKAEPTTVAILAKAPVPGFAKTRLTPLLGADGAAALQARLIRRIVETTLSASIGPTTVWATPDPTHTAFTSLSACAISLARQPDGDLGARMLAAVAATNGPALVVGTDCPVLTAGHLQQAADALRTHDVIVIPAEDGGYCLIGMRQPQPALFSEMPWSTASVMSETRRRLDRLGLAWRELPSLWDVDTEHDLMRLRREGPAGLID